MKRDVFFYLLTILLFYCPLLSENRVEIDFPDYQFVVYQEACTTEIWVYIINDEIITEAAMGFEIKTLDNINFSVYSAKVAPSSRFEDALPWDFSFSGTTDLDSVIIYSDQYDPGEYPGVQPGSMELAFIITLDLSEYDWYSNYTNEVLSIRPLALEPLSEYWYWNYIRPLTDPVKYLEFGVLPCGSILFTARPENDTLTGTHCGAVQFQFEAINVIPDPEYHILGYSMQYESYGAEIDNEGFFTFNPGQHGTYYLTVDARDNCALHECYSFDVVITNYGFDMTNIPGGKLIRPPGTEIIHNFEVVSLDCDTVESETLNIIGSPRAEPVNPPEMNAGVFSWQTDPADLGLWQFELIYEDQYGASESCLFEIELTDTYICGDVNADESANVSDAVYLINYVFADGADPNPPASGDVNCDMSTNVSDAVWIINYVFLSGPAPCECR